MDEATRKAALDAIFEKQLALTAERRSVQRQITDLTRRNHQIEQELADCGAAARLFGASDTEIEMRLHAAHEKTEEAEDRRIREFVRSETLVTPASAAPGRGEMPKIKDIVLDRLKAAGPAGTKAAAIREYIDLMWGTEANPIHEKTVGMSLYRLLKHGLAHRRGITWIYGPDPSGTQNPGGETPGPMDDLLG